MKKRKSVASFLVKVITQRSKKLSSYEHKKLIDLIAKLDTPPENPEEFSEWIKARAHLDLLLHNANSDEIIMFASGEYTFVHSAVISNNVLSSIDKEDLLDWDGAPYDSAASYVYGGGREDVWVERGDSSRFSDASDGITQMVFIRTFEGAKDDRDYFELNQEYTHLTGIHWRPEHDAFVRYDRNGDIDPIVSATHDREKKVTLVSFKKGPLEDYLAATDSSIIRRFDFTLLRRGSFSRWSDNPENSIEEDENFFYRQKVDGNAAYTNGRQIIPLSRAREDVFKQKKANFFGEEVQEYAEFIIYDWRNEVITRVSTDPQDTTNYFQAENNSLPFELSPAFFRPDVLLKYKADRDKYTIDEREISCRASWHLRAYDINEAGQVHAYICYLRNLPYSEQQYWASFNEEPKAGISERAITTDFRGEFTDIISPLSRVLRKMNEWHQKEVLWWSLKEDDLLKQVNLPITSNKDEWAEAFMGLSKLIIEGFKVKPIRLELDRKSISYDKAEGSISLLEKLIRQEDNYNGLGGLRTSQLIRTKVKGHSNGTEARELEKNVLKEHKTFKKHFEHICAMILEELELIEDAFS